MNTVSPELFIRSVAEGMENRHYLNTPSHYITEAFVNDAFHGYERLDEGVMDVIKTLLKPITWPVEKIANFWKNDRELIAEVDKAEKSLPKTTIAALYCEEFADTNIVQDMWDMMCMLKDVFLLRYKHIPWRTAISAAGLVAYYFSPWNITLGTAILNWLGGPDGAAGSGFHLFGGGSAETGVEPTADNVTKVGADAGADTAKTIANQDGAVAKDLPSQTSIDQKPIAELEPPEATKGTVVPDSTPSGVVAKPDPSWKPAPADEYGPNTFYGGRGVDNHPEIWAWDETSNRYIDINQPAIPEGANREDYWYDDETGSLTPVVDVNVNSTPRNDTFTWQNLLPTNDPEVKIANDGSVVGELDFSSMDDRVVNVGETLTWTDNNGQTFSGVILEKGDVWTPDGEHGWETASVDMNGDGKADIHLGPSEADIKAAMSNTNESVTALLVGGGAAAAAGVTALKAYKSDIINACKTAEPYLNHLDELLIAFLLWKWFKKDLRDYRKWLVTKDVAKDELKRKRSDRDL